MANALSAQQTAHYNRDGFLFPIDIMTADEAAALRSTIERVEAGFDAAAAPRDLNQYFRVNAHVVLPFLAETARHPAILDAVQGILGPDLLAWSCELFIKEPGTPKVVSWHQDLTYWGMGETDDEVTAWLAVSDVSQASGCMRFVAGSHHQRIVPHRDTFADDNLLSRGQEIAVQVDENEATMVELKPGQMSLHHGRMFHASGPNVSSDRRIGLAIRYVAPRVQQSIGERDYAMLVRGADRSRNWINIAAPTQNFAAESLTLYEQIMEDQAKALAQGAEGEVGLYQARA